MKFYIFGMALYDRAPRRVAGPYKHLSSARHQVRVLRWEGYRGLRIRRKPAAGRARPRVTARQG